MQFDQDQKLSPTEQRIQNDDERHRSGYSIGHLGGHINGPKPETPERARERKARAIPEETFADDQELIRLRHDRDLKVDIARDPYSLGSWCAEHGRGQGIAKEAASDSLMWSMLEDARNQDAGFPASLSVLQDLLVRQRFQQGLIDLHDKINAFGGAYYFRGEADRARRAYEDRLFALQLAYFDKMEQRSA
jgi:hypothetical protein